MPLGAPVLPRRLAPVFPTPYSPYYLHMAKAQAMLEHLGSPYHSFLHCKGFAPAAPRGAWTNISVSISGLPLSWPVLIFGLVVRYTTNDLIRRHLILRHDFRKQIVPDIVSYQVLATVSRSYPCP